MMTSPLEMQSRLPVPTTPFVGRQQELTDILTRLHDDSCRLLTLVGPGGTGKTRLAIEAAAQTTAFPDGVYFVGLQSLVDSALIVCAISDTLDLAEDGQADMQERLIDYLIDKSMLLVLDNFEHLLDDLTLVTVLLECIPSIKLLVTSREILNLQEEWLYHVGGMRFPRDDETAPLESYSAIRLFVQSARRAQPQFRLETEQESVRRICELVAGMPLAIELAAAWLKRLSCAEIVSELECNFDILETSARNVPERHRSMRVVLQQSWAALTPEEQQVFKRLAIFRGGFRREAAEIIAGASLRTLGALVDKSFLRLEPSGHYDIHELLRQYGEEHLNANPEEARDTLSRHSSYYAQRLLTIENSELAEGEKKWLLNVVEIIDNVRAAFHWSIKVGHVPNMHHMIAGLSSYYQVRYDYQEAVATFTAAVERLRNIVYPDTELHQRTLANCLTCQAWYLIAYDRKAEALAILEEALSLLRSFPADVELANVLWRLSFLYTENGILDIENRFEIGQRYALEALEITRAMPTAHFMIDSIDMLGQFAYERGDFERARTLFTESLTLAQHYGLYWAASNAHTQLGVMDTLQGHLQEAERHSAEALKQSRLMNDRWTIVHASFAIGLLKYTQAQFADSYRHFQTGLQEGKTLGDAWVLVTAHTGMGVAKWYLDDFAAAWVELQTALQIAVNTPLRSDLHPVALVGIAEILANVGQHETAVALFTYFADHITSRYVVKDRAKRFLSRLESQMTPPIFRAAQTRGKALVLTEVIRTWLNAPLPTMTAIIPDEPEGVLTERELEILRLIADGLSNKAIADELILSVGTVKWYVNQIFSKLPAANRTGAVARGRELGLLA